MKVFWALVAVLVLGAAVMAVRSMDGPAAGSGRTERAAESGTAAVAPPETGTATEASRPTVAEASEPLPTPHEPAPAPPPDDAPSTTAPSVEGPAAPAPAESPEVTAASTAEETAEPAAAPAPEVPLPAELEELVAGAIGNAEAPAPAPAGPPGPPAADKPMVAEQPDGSKLVAGRFILKGEGTKEKPYEVTWDMLVAAQETYKPRLGQKTLPPFLDLLHGKFVTVGGFVAFPLMAQSADEMLVMLNQWDGCCIGIPPTPYDAVEVRLATPAEGETRFKVSGSVTGKFAVDPYLVKDWLIGLYTMEDAELTTE